MNDIVPISNRPNGDDRDAQGRFKTGWRGGPGSPVAAHARELHKRLTDALHDVVTPERLAVAIDSCLKSAEGGDVSALRLLLERLSPMDQQVSLRIQKIEALLGDDGDD